MQPTSDEVWTAEDEATYRPLREKSEYQKVKENIINDIEGTIWLFFSD